MLAWTMDGDTFYTLLDGNGNSISDTYTIEGGSLSDCAPIVHEGKIIWYTYEDNVVSFYEISVDDIASTAVTESCNGHEMEIVSYPSAPGEDCSVKCEKCGETDTVATGIGIRVFWSLSYGGTYSYPLNENFSIDQNLYVSWCDLDCTWNCYGTEVTVSDESAVAFTQTEECEGYFTFNAPGTYYITFSYTYNPSVFTETEVIVTEDSIYCGYYYEPQEESSEEASEDVSYDDSSEDVSDGWYDNWYDDWYDNWYDNWYDSSYDVSYDFSYDFSYDGSYDNGYEDWYEDWFGSESDTNDGTEETDGSDSGNGDNSGGEQNSNSDSSNGFLLGDVNLNGEIDSLDYILLKRAYFGTFMLNEQQSKNGDINRNGAIDSLDYILLKRAYFGTYKI